MPAFSFGCQNRGPVRPSLGVSSKPEGRLCFVKTLVKIQTEKLGQVFKWLENGPYTPILPGKLPGQADSD